MTGNYSGKRFRILRLPGVSAVVVALLGAWLGMTLGVWWVATGSFDVLSAEHNPALSQVFKALPAPERALRYAAGEVNRRLFRGWNATQLVLGLALLGLTAWRGGRAFPGRRGWLLGLEGVLLVVVLAHLLWLGPQIETLGRLLDFADRATQAEVARRFGLAHAAYVVSDMAKALLLLVALWIASVPTGRREV